MDAREIGENIRRNKYLYLLSFALLFISSVLLKLMSIEMVVPAFLCMTVVLNSNDRHTADNSDVIFLLQGAAISVMAGSYLYFTPGWGRLEFFVNFGLGFLLAAAAYGFYSKKR